MSTLFDPLQPCQNGGGGDDRESLADGVEHGVDERQEAEREEEHNRACHAVSLSEPKRVGSNGVLTSVVRGMIGR